MKLREKDDPIQNTWTLEAPDMIGTYAGVFEVHPASSFESSFDSSFDRGNFDKIDSIRLLFQSFLKRKLQILKVCDKVDSKSGFSPLDRRNSTVARP